MILEEYHHIQKINNYFQWKKRNTALHTGKICKHGYCETKLGANDNEGKTTF